MYRYQITPQIQAPIEVTPPAAEPVTLAELKKHLEIPSGDTSHDDQLNALITAARQKWERDTQKFYILRTMKMEMDHFCQCKFPHEPIDSITSITYYDTGNNQQTLSTDIYELDVGRRELRLKYQKDWPSQADRWDSVTITYVLGSAADATEVDEIAKAAMKLLAGHYFENRDMIMPDNMAGMRAYQALVANYMRSSYP